MNGEAVRRGYSFDARKIAAPRSGTKIPVTRGQVAYESAHLLRKLEVRAPKELALRRRLARPALHPSFRAVAGGIADWERP